MEEKMINRDMIKQIIEIPKEFKRKKDISIFQLLVNTGYIKNKNDINIEDIKKELKEKPELIQFWLNYSEDKRTSGGWYLLKKNDSTFIVGNIDGRSKSIFTDCFDACATFIKKEIEAIRNE
jgi:hypothetical protein